MQENQQFEVNLSYTVRLCLNTHNFNLKKKKQVEVEPRNNI